jgi:hypothetical protein
MSITVSIPDKIAEFIYWRIDESLGDYQTPDELQEQMYKWFNEVYKPKMGERWRVTEQRAKETGGRGDEKVPEV